MIKLLKGNIPEDKTYLELDGEIFQQLSGIEVQAGGETVTIRFSKPRVTKDAQTSVMELTMPKPQKVTTPKSQNPIGKQLEALRTELDVPWIEFAKLAGLTTTTVKKMRDGIGTTQEGTLRKLTRFFKKNGRQLTL